MSKSIERRLDKLGATLGDGIEYYESQILDEIFQAAQGRVLQPGMPIETREYPREMMATTNEERDQFWCRFHASVRAMAERRIAIAQGHTAAT